MEQQIHGTLCAMKKIWDLLGLDGDEQAERLQQVVGVCQSWLQREETNVEEEAQALMDRVKLNRRQLAILQGELDVQLVDLEEEMPLYKMDAVYGKAVEELQSEKANRWDRWHKLADEYVYYSKRMAKPEPFDANPDLVPKYADLDQLQTDLDLICKRYKFRLAQFRDYANKISRVASSLGFTGRTDFEKEIIHYDGGEPVLTRDHVELMQELLDELRETYKRKRDAKLEELTDMWDKCYIGLNHRRQFLCDPNVNAAAFAAYDAEMERLRLYYEDRKEVLAAVEVWDRLWASKVELEVQASNVDRYKNRGGWLLREEKARRELKTNLTIAAQNVLNAATAWSAEHPDTPLLVDDLPVMDRLEQKEIQFEQEMKEEREARKMLKRGAVPKGSSKVLKTTSHGPTRHQQVRSWDGQVPRIVIRSPSCGCIPDQSPKPETPMKSASVESVNDQPVTYQQFLTNLQLRSPDESLVCYQVNSTVVESDS